MREAWIGWKRGYRVEMRVDVDRMEERVGGAWVEMRVDVDRVKSVGFYRSSKC